MIGAWVGAAEQQTLITDAGAVMNAIVNSQSVTDFGQDGIRSRLGDLVEPWNDQTLEGDLEKPDLLFDGIHAHREIAQLLQEWVRLARTADFLGQTHPGFAVAGLVTRHRRIIQASLLVGSSGEKLHRALDGDHVRLKLLRDHRAPHSVAASSLLRRSDSLGHWSNISPRELANIPRLALRQTVVALHALGGGLRNAGLLNYVNRHSGPLFRVALSSLRSRSGRYVVIVFIRMALYHDLPPSYSATGE